MDSEYKPSSVPTPVSLRVVNAVISLFSLAFIVTFIVIASARLFYPFELEWIEGVAIDASRWILDGHFLYTQPSIQFIPLLYGPVFFYVSAFSMQVLGIGFTAARLVSILSTVGCFALLFLIVSRSSSNSTAGLLAAGIYAASYRFAGAWMDLAKVDSLALFFLLAGFWVSRRFPSREGMIGSSVLYVLAFYTKQNAVIVILVLLLLSLVESRGRTWFSLASVAIIGVAVLLFLDFVSQGWYSFYAFNSVLYGFTSRSALGIFPSKFCTAYWPAILVAVFYFVLKGRSLLQNSMVGQEFRANVAFACILIASSWITFLHPWSYDNDFLPACLGIAALAGLGFAEISRQINRGDQRKYVTLFFDGVLLGLFLLQFCILSYNPLAQIPRQADRNLWAEFVSRLEKLPGQVWVPHHGYVNYLAGKTTYLHSSTYTEAAGLAALPARTENDIARRAFVRQIGEEAVRKQEFEWVVAGEPTSIWLPYYIYTQDLFENSRVFFSVTGMAQPEGLLRRNSVAHGGLLPLNDPFWNLLFKEGWGSPEEGGRQAIGNHTAVLVALERGHNYRIVLQVQPFCQSLFTEETMKAGWNQYPLGDYTFTSCAQQSVSFTLPSREVTGLMDNLWFEFRNLSSDTMVHEDAPETMTMRFTSITFLQEPER